MGVFKNEMNTSILEVSCLTVTWNFLPCERAVLVGFPLKASPWWIIQSFCFNKSICSSNFPHFCQIRIWIHSKERTTMGKKKKNLPKKKNDGGKTSHECVTWITYFIEKTRCIELTFLFLLVCVPDNKPNCYATSSGLGTIYQPLCIGIMNLWCQVTYISSNSSQYWLFKHLNPDIVS